MNIFSRLGRGNLSSPTDVGDSYPAGQYNLSKGGSVYAVKDGNQYIWNFQGDAPYCLRPFDPSLPILSPQIVQTSPSRLLAAQYEVVDLVGRKSELDELTKWASGKSQVAVRVVHAVGGQGKTRLATRFARKLSKSGWAVAEAFHATSLSIGLGDHPAAADQGSGLLVVIDYADRWPAIDLISLFRAHMHLPGPVRVLLIARGVSGWWPSIETSLMDAGICDVDKLALPPLAVGLVREGLDTTAAFHTAVKAFAPYLGLDTPELVPAPENISALDNEHALTLYMAALAATDATVKGVAIPSDKFLSKYLLNRERNGWNQLQQANRISISARQLGHASFVAALTSALPYDDGRMAIQAAGVASSMTDADQVLADHMLVYPTTAVGTVLESMAPDRLAEDYLAFTLLTTEEYGFGDIWAMPALANLITPKKSVGETNPEALPVYARHLVTTLVEAASRWPKLLTDVLWPLMTGSPALMLVGGGATVARLAKLARTDAAMLSLIGQQLPKNAHVEFDQAAAVVAEYLLALSSNADAKARPDQYANTLLETGYRYYNAGKYEQADVESSKAVKIYRSLADQKSGGFAVHGASLARALTNLSTYLVKQRKAPEALAAAQEAIAIHKLLAAHDPSTSQHYLPDFALTLNNLGPMLLEQGNGQDAVAATQKAVDIYRILADPKTGDFATHGARLAGSLSNLGTQLSWVHQPEPALTATQEAVEKYKVLINSEPNDAAANLPELAGALSNLSNRLLELGRGEEALVKIKESVDIYRILSDQETGNPDFYLPDLANSLVNLGAVWSGLKWNNEALPPTAEAMEIYQRLADPQTGKPNTYRPELARTWNNLGHILSQGEKWPEAMDAAQKAVKFYGELADPQTGSPAAYGNLLEKAINNLRIISMKLGGPKK